MTDALEFWEWDTAVGPECLTIEDVLKLPPGEPVEVLSMHRNLCDHVYPRGKPKKGIEVAAKFFKEHLSTFTYLPIEGATLQGILTLPGVSHPLVMELHIEYGPDHWYPLKNDVLPEPDEPWMQNHPDPPYPTGKRWDAFPKSTRVGYRGPILLASKLPSLPDVFTRIQMENLASRAAMDWLKGADLPVPSNRIWIRFEEGKLVVTVHDLTDDEKVALEQVLHGVPIKPFTPPSDIRVA